MNQMNSFDGYAELIQPATLRIERLLPGTRERVWEYLTQSDLRRQWMAAGDMEEEEGSSFELVWRKRMITTLATCALREIRGDDMRAARQRLARQLV